MKIRNKKYRIIGYITTIAIFFLLIIPAYYFSELPQEVPLHFGISGKADKYSSKSNIWLMPIIGLISYAGALRLEKNLLSKNRKKPSRELVFIIKNLKILILIFILAFLYITIQMILVALKKSEGLGSWFIYILIFSVIVFPLLPLIKRNNKI